VDLRRFQRTPIDEDVTFAPAGADAAKGAHGRARDISLGGMFIETKAPLPFGANLSVVIRLSGETLVLPAVSRWARDSGMGVQFGLLGARETHLITELSRAE
jgi:type IV pilus assembly protein PilZ